MRNKEAKVAYEQRYYKKTKTERAAYHRNWTKKNRTGNPEYRARTLKQRLELKLEVLSHYGANGKLQCCWQDCIESDLDVLTLDHVHNDGKDERKSGVLKHGDGLYRHLRALGFPSGMFQTLCMNHQLKKEITRKRSELMQRCSDSQV